MIDLCGLLQVKDYGYIICLSNIDFHMFAVCLTKYVLWCLTKVMVQFFVVVVVLGPVVLILKVQYYVKSILQFFNNNVCGSHSE